MNDEKVEASFTDGKPRVATVENLAARWNGRPNGEHFRCRLCGPRFKVGDVWRFVYSNFEGSPFRWGNFFVCVTCDGADVLEQAVAQEKEAKTRFWFFLRDE